jgi:hypothetical protein
LAKLIKPKAIQMKKLLAILTVAGIIIACNDNGGTEDPNGDTTRLPSTVSPADTSTIPIDTPARAADTVIKK